MHVTHMSACACRNLGGTTESLRPLLDEGCFFIENSIGIADYGMQMAGYFNHEGKREEKRNEG